MIGMKLYRYICEQNVVLGIETYYKQFYLTEHQAWGVKKKITKATFKKREAEGRFVEYVEEKFDFRIFKVMASEIDSLIDLALMTKDEKWFMDLSRQRKLLCEIVK
jgi:hypothetical protein